MTFYVKCYHIASGVATVKNDYSSYDVAEKALKWFTDHDDNPDHWYYIDDKYDD